MFQRAGVSSGGSGGGSWTHSTQSVIIPANGSIPTAIDTANKSVYIAGNKNNYRIAALIYDGQVLDSTVKNYIKVSCSSTAKKQIILTQTLSSEANLTLQVYTQG